MVKKTITFSGMAFFINDSRTNEKQFRELFQPEKTNKIKGNFVSIFDYAFEKHFLKIAFCDGSTMPRNPKVFNKETEKLEDNPRNNNQIEPKEHFAVLDLTNSYLWLNNTNKKTLLLDQFRSHLKNKEIKLKDVYEESKFIESLKTLDQIKISAAPSLFGQSNALSNSLIDEMYGAYEAVLDLKYRNTFIGDNLLDKLKSIFNNRSSFNSITISGRDEKNFGMFFNNNLFTRKLDITSTIDENGMFDQKEVFDNLIYKIESEFNQH